MKIIGLDSQAMDIDSDTFEPSFVDEFDSGEASFLDRDIAGQMRH